MLYGYLLRIAASPQGELDEEEGLLSNSISSDSGRGVEEGDWSPVKLGYVEMQRALGYVVTSLGTSFSTAHKAMCP